MLGQGLEVLESGLPTETWRRAHAIIERHTTALAEDLMAMFQDEVLQPYRDRGRPRRRARPPRRRARPAEADHGARGRHGVRAGGEPDDPPAAGLTALSAACLPSLPHRAATRRHVHRAPHAPTSHPTGGVRRDPVGCEVPRWVRRAAAGCEVAGCEVRRKMCRAGGRDRHRAPHVPTSHPTGGVRGNPVGCEVPLWGARCRRGVRGAAAGCAVPRRGAPCRGGVRRAAAGCAVPRRGAPCRGGVRRAAAGCAVRGGVRRAAAACAAWAGATGTAHPTMPTAHPTGGVRGDPVGCAVPLWGARCRCGVRGEAPPGWAARALRWTSRSGSEPP